jgi:hypothetical protein
MNFYPNPDGSAFAITFKARHDILTAMGKLNPHTKILDSSPSPGANSRGSLNSLDDLMEIAAVFAFN